jgi:hypothetical protein
LADTIGLVFDKITICREKRNCLLNSFWVIPINIAGLSRGDSENPFWIFGEIDGIKQNSGSRYSDGNVPNVNFNDGKVNVNRYDPSNSNDNLRSRLAEVSGKKEKSPVFSGLFCFKSFPPPPTLG